MLYVCAHNTHTQVHTSKHTHTHTHFKTHTHSLSLSQNTHTHTQKKHTHSKHTHTHTSKHTTHLTTLTQVGMGCLIILVNARLSELKFESDEQQEFFNTDFQTVYHLQPNPVAGWNGGVLFRAFPVCMYVCMYAKDVYVYGRFCMCGECV